MKSSIKIGSVMGIPIKLHITFLLILPFLAYAFAVTPPPVGFGNVQDALVKYGLGVIAAILLFACVLVHELGHSYIAVKNGIKISDITLFLFGGVSSMEEVPRNPSVELLMAAIGPAISIVIGLAFGAVYVLMPSLWSTSYIGTIVFLLAYLNIALGIFNILPAFPMDGGRVLRAFLAQRMPYIKATGIAVGIGKLFAFLLGVFGLFMGMHGIWLILIAFFIYIAAGEEERSTMVSATLEGVRVKDVMTRDVVAMEAGMTISQCIDIMFKLKHLGYPVVENGRMVGIVALEDVSRVPADARNTTTVKDIMTRNVITVKPEDEAFDALQKLSRHNIGRLIVVDNDRIAGIISRTDLLRSIEIYEVARAGRMKV